MVQQKRARRAAHVHVILQWPGEFLEDIQKNNRECATGAEIVTAVMRTVTFN
jgi:hypothetical protein